MRYCHISDSVGSVWAMRCHVVGYAFRLDVGHVVMQLGIVIRVNYYVNKGIGYKGVRKR